MQAFASVKTLARALRPLCRADVVALNRHNSTEKRILRFGRQILSYEM